MPTAAAKLLDAMGVASSLRTFAGIRSTWYSPLAEAHFTIDAPTGLFPRLELPEEAAA
jgi:methionyl-tRNA synthetase